MDTRFCRPKKIKYPLYLSENSFKVIREHIFNNFGLKIRRKKNLERLLRTEIGNVFNVSIDDVMLFGSGSSAIVSILNYLKVKLDIKKAYIPSFSCMELADCVISSGYVLDVYDITNKFDPDYNFIMKLKDRDDIVLILPSYFGATKLENSLFEFLMSQSFPVIFDEAQSFPMEPMIKGYYDKNWFSIVSFGKSKPISSIGGGAVIINNRYDPFIKGYKQEMQRIYGDKYFSQYYKLCIKIIANIANKYTISKYIPAFNRKKVAYYDTLQDLVLDKKENIIKPNPISKLQAEMAYFRILNFRRSRVEKEVLTQLIESISNTLGFESLEYLKDDILNQNFMLLKVSNNQRYSLAKWLAIMGVQTTFYYYPIHLIPYYNKRFNLNTCINAESLSKNLLIIPFNIDYSKDKIKRLIKIFKEGYKIV